jgi:hypothetical protein
MRPGQQRLYQGRRLYEELCGLKKHSPADRPMNKSVISWLILHVDVNCQFDQFGWRLVYVQRSAHVFIGLSACQDGENTGDCCNRQRATVLRSGAL